ncbi:MAG: DUF429 domain-containing protein [Desulfuromonadales bacterium]|nr:DUF429 domain-containing protein [Desulfuromonadales bacterium]
MSILTVGFDAAWTAKNSGAIVGVILEKGVRKELGPPSRVNYIEAEKIILKWQTEYLPVSTIIMVDQPTIVKNSRGQRPVEHIVSAPVSLRRGGVQPANTSKEAMFGPNAPIWPFLDSFNGPANPISPSFGNQVYETYPVLSLIALGWTLPDERPSGRLPKYNPGRKNTFSTSDWNYLCRQVSAAFKRLGLGGITGCIDNVGHRARPSKEDQDCLDACICLLVALAFAEQRDCLIVGDQLTGYMVVPHDNAFRAELEVRCIKTNREPKQWVKLLSNFN